MTLWTAAEAAAATGGRAVGDWSATGVSIDSRTLQPGDLFVALRAARDGHDFVAQALDNGAAAALVSHLPEGVTGDAPLLLVDDVQSALEALGRAARARSTASVVAVTGSVGKTSTKEMLRAILAGQGRTHAAEASYNNHWGVPLTLARMPRDTDFAVIEIGMNHPGEIAPLSRLARPHVAMITTVAAAHLEAFDSVEDIAREKAAILDGLEKGGVAVLNTDIPTASILRDKARAVGARLADFGETAEAWRLCDVTLRGNTTIARAEARGEPLLFKVRSAGRHFALNALGALAAADALGADLALAAGDLGRWVPFTGRGARETIHLDPVETELHLELIDDAYNANPASVGAALEVLAAALVEDDVGRIGKGRRIAVLGDMKELGEGAPAMHAALALHPAMTGIDTVHCVGPLMRHLHAALPSEKRGKWCEDSAAMAPGIRHLVDAGDCVLVKGSLSMDLARVVDAIRKLGHAAPHSNDEDA
ncbi:UDP-N-acetylmuramoyl-tripeptide--D-alanyl-D-alanine ligase [Salinihabitans flavidus]|uniref:UDP-N-acetylmuramoyl-tripeptide--D-alanyl-D-alanine ligase n=1 Tax=Salinihabitans flavidus TaxID=569882 RepID=A0A1H8U7B6_9RHOB|nr:UDP-N-acetylmuramoyl-tripeptide--D-alanyl-D-alanine ligase [Salinihabitans flavidus]SEO98976.1 UDP-N-acetylmuramoyl-tripeptide--D-alanyl-D-alanine ligase [Salinihabitans flavidus]